MSASFVLRIFGPKELGGFGDIKSQGSIQAEATGRDEDDIIKEVSKNCFLIPNRCRTLVQFEMIEL